MGSPYEVGYGDRIEEDEVQATRSNQAEIIYIYIYIQI
jgi:hypothetical protein